MSDDDLSRDPSATEPEWARRAPDAIDASAAEDDAEASPRRLRLVVGGRAEGDPSPFERLRGRARRGGSAPRAEFDPNPPPFRLELFRDIDPAPRKDWMVDDLLGAGELSVWFGAPGCGKSAVIGDAACHVAAGLDWFGRRVRRCGVLYIAAERASLVKRRMAAWRKHHGLDDLPLAVVSGMIDLVSDHLDAERIALAARQLTAETGIPTGWIIVDTKAQVMGGGDENSPQDMMGLVHALAAIQAATGAHVTVIDHVPHYDPNRMRGHGALLGAADATFKVSKDGDLRFIQADKSNDGPDNVRLSFSFESIVLSVDDETGKETTAPVVVPSERQPDTGQRPGHVRLSDSEEIALRHLKDALAEAGEKPPPTDHIPRSVTVVRVETWRNRCYKGQISGSDKPEARQKAFKRAADALQRKGRMATWGEWAWII
ncbi:AAA family ATPase [Salinarimonas chemoclinalis]|uniref:AAA family ATPase n=1 Tax=Salinarimonas chemoclinalis TaxID=3241599 RepID=UPI003555C971